MLSFILFYSTLQEYCIKFTWYKVLCYIRPLMQIINVQHYALSAVKPASTVCCTVLGDHVFWKAIHKEKYLHFSNPSLNKAILLAFIEREN